MGRNIKFKPILVTVALDNTGNRVTIKGNDPGLKMQEELSIQVVD
jgi:hypothetical protein